MVNSMELVFTLIEKVSKIEEHGKMVKELTG
jgi:hypothetical protein